MAVAVGITFAIVCLLFNCIFRNRKWVDFLVWQYVLTYAIHYHHATVGLSAWLVQISTTSSLLVPCYFMHLLFFTSSPQPMSSLLRYFARWDYSSWPCEYLLFLCALTIVALVDSDTRLFHVLWYYCCQNATSLLHIPSTIATDQKENGIIYQVHHLSITFTIITVMYIAPSRLVPCDDCGWFMFSWNHHSHICGDIWWLQSCNGKG